MKKRILLTIMILFSTNVNSNDECKLPDIKFFEIVKEGNVEKFNFMPFFDKIQSDLQGSVSGNVDILGVKLNKNATLGALLKIHEFFFEKLIERQSSKSIETNESISWTNVFAGGYEPEKSFKQNNAEKLAKSRFSYEQKIKIADNQSVIAALQETDDKIRNKISMLIKYFIKEEETKKEGFFRRAGSYFTSWFRTENPEEMAEHVGPVKYFKVIDYDAFNASLNFIYLYALSFLIKNEQDSSKFSRCMISLYTKGELANKLNTAMQAGVSQAVPQIFQEIVGEIGGQVKLEPLTLEEKRNALSLLSSTLNSLANLKFT